jgi:hypothetical protein
MCEICQKLQEKVCIAKFAVLVTRVHAHKATLAEHSHAIEQLNEAELKLNQAELTLAEHQREHEMIEAEAA